MKTKHTQKKSARRPWQGVLPHRMFKPYVGWFYTTAKQPIPTYKNR